MVNLRSSSLFILFLVARVSLLMYGTNLTDINKPRNALSITWENPVSTEQLLGVNKHFYIRIYINSSLLTKINVYLYQIYCKSHPLLKLFQYSKTNSNDMKLPHEPLCLTLFARAKAYKDLAPYLSNFTFIKLYYLL